MINVTELLEYLSYEPLTGIFTWKKTLCNTAIEGTRAGSLSNGYRVIQVNKQKIYEHDAAWLMSGRVIPSGSEIDHRNLIKWDNSLNNLRCVTKSQNQHNRGLNKNNKTGVKGVSVCTQTGLYKARVICNGKEFSAGRHKTLDEAEQAVKLKRIELHGKFARHS